MSQALYWLEDGYLSPNCSKLSLSFRRSYTGKGVHTELEPNRILLFEVFFALLGPKTPFRTCSGWGLQ